MKAFLSSGFFLAGAEAFSLSVEMTGGLTSVFGAAQVVLFSVFKDAIFAEETGVFLVAFAGDTFLFKAARCALSFDLKAGVRVTLEGFDCGALGGVGD